MQKKKHGEGAAGDARLSGSSIVPQPCWEPPTRCSPTCFCLGGSEADSSTSLPPCRSPSLNVPVCPPWHLQPWLCDTQSHPGLPWRDPNPQQEPGIAPRTSKRHICTWRTGSFCFKWTKPLKTQPIPHPGECSGQALPHPQPLLPQDDVPPAQGHQHTVHCAISPSHTPLPCWEAQPGQLHPPLVPCAQGWTQMRHPQLVSAKREKL